MAWEELETISINRTQRWYRTELTQSDLFRIVRIGGNNDRYIGLMARWGYNELGDITYWAFKKIYAYDPIQIVNLKYHPALDQEGGVAVKLLGSVLNPNWGLRIDRWEWEGDNATEFLITQANLTPDGQFIAIHNLQTNNPQVVLGASSGMLLYCWFDIIDNNKIRVDMSGLIPLQETYRLTVGRKI